MQSRRCGRAGDVVELRCCGPHHKPVLPGTVPHPVPWAQTPYLFLPKLPFSLSWVPLNLGITGEACETASKPYCNKVMSGELLRIWREKSKSFVLAMPEVSVTLSEGVRYFWGMYLKMFALNISHFKIF